MKSALPGAALGEADERAVLALAICGDARAEFGLVADAMHGVSAVALDELAPHPFGHSERTVSRSPVRRKYSPSSSKKRGVASMVCPKVRKLIV